MGIAALKRGHEHQFSPSAYYQAAEPRSAGAGVKQQLSLQANPSLKLNLVSWLAQDDDFININVKATPDATLTLGDRAHLVIAVGFLLALPLLLIAAGVTIWWRRRRG